MMQKNLTDNELIRIRKEKLSDLVAQGRDPHKITKYDVTIHADELVENFDSYQGDNFSLAGRIMAKRGHGKISFIDLQDSFGRIQVIARFNDMKDFSVIKDLDIGDIIGVKGQATYSDRGEKSVSAEEIVLLTKSIKPLPEKYHGLKDMDLRYRQRYVDLIMNPEVKQVFVQRSKIISGIRSFLDNIGFLEVETPILNTIAGGAAARPFITHHNSLDIDMYLRIANELYLKRLIVGGFDRVYEMGRMFRNEGMDASHNPEYTAIELYQSYTDHNGVMEITENMISKICKDLHGSHKISYGGNELDLSAPWRRITMTEAVKEYSGVDFSNIRDDDEAKRLADEHEIEYSQTDGWGKILSLFFDKYAEEKMIQPTFVYEYPVEISPLAKRSPGNPDMTDRFEAFVNGWEIANGFAELNDAQDQLKRFEHQLELRKAGDEEANMMDEDFVNALEIGLPPTGGLGIGVDRVIMILTGQSSIRDVLLFPTMKPLAKDSNESDQDSGEGDTCHNCSCQAEKLDLSKIKVEPLFEDMVDFETFLRSDFRAVKVKNCEEVPKSKKLLKFTLDDGSEKERVILSGIKEYYSAESLIGKTLLAICNLPPRKMMGIDSEGMIISAICEYDGEEKLNLIMLDDNIPAGSKLY